MTIRTMFQDCSSNSNQLQLGPVTVLMYHTTQTCYKYSMQKTTAAGLRAYDGVGAPWHPYCPANAPSNTTATSKHAIGGLRAYDDVSAPYHPDCLANTQCKTKHSWFKALWQFWCTIQPRPSHRHSMQKIDHEYVRHTLVKGKNECPFL